MLMTENQGKLFDVKREMGEVRSIEPIDQSAVASDAPRMRGQNAAILDRLMQGPATNAELATISLKYTSRISDIRAAGYQVECHRGEGGLNVYRLTSPG